MRFIHLCATALFIGVVWSCKETKEVPTKVVEAEQTFDYVVDQFADLRILRYQIPGFESLGLKEKQLVYYLTQAGLAGRDIMWDQNYRHNLEIRDALEHIYATYSGDKSAEDWLNFEIYLKRIWFSNGIHHHYSNDKIKPGFEPAYLTYLMKETDTDLVGEAFEVIFNDKDSKKVNKKKGVDNVLASAINFYDPTITSAEVEAFYAKADKGPKDRPIEAGLNSKLVRKMGRSLRKSGNPEECTERPSIK